MSPRAAIAQLRTTDLEASIQFYTKVLGFTLAFRFGDFYAGVKAGEQMVHLKLVDAPDPGLAAVASGEHFHLYIEVDDADGYAARLEQVGVSVVSQPQDKPWGMREFVVRDDQGHTLFCGGPSSRR